MLVSLNDTLNHGLVNNDDFYCGSVQRLQENDFLSMQLVIKFYFIFLINYVIIFLT